MAQSKSNLFALCFLSCTEMNIVVKKFFSRSMLTPVFVSWAFSVIRWLISLIHHHFETLNIVSRCACLDFYRRDMKIFVIFSVWECFLLNSKDIKFSRKFHDKSMRKRCFTTQLNQIHERVLERSEKWCWWW